MTKLHDLNATEDVVVRFLLRQGEQTIIDESWVFDRRYHDFRRMGLDYLRQEIVEQVNRASWSVYSPPREDRS